MLDSSSSSAPISVSRSTERDSTVVLLVVTVINQEVRVYLKLPTDNRQLTNYDLGAINNSYIGSLNDLALVFDIRSTMF